MLSFIRGKSKGLLEMTTAKVSETDPKKVIWKVLEGMVSITNRLEEWLKKAGVSIRDTAKAGKSRFQSMASRLFSRSKDSSSSVLEEVVSDSSEAGDPPQSTGPPEEKKGLLSRLNPFGWGTPKELREEQRRQEVEDEKNKSKDREENKKKKGGFLGMLLKGLGPVVGGLATVLLGGLKPIIGHGVGMLLGGLKMLLKPLLGTVLGKGVGLMAKGAGKLMGGMAGLAGRGLMASAGFLVTNPIGLTILGGAAVVGAVYGGRKLWKMYTKNKIPKGVQGALIELRLCSYGISQQDTKEHNHKIWNLESMLEEHVDFRESGELVFRNWSQENLIEAAEILGVDLSNYQYVKYFEEWWKNRFIPAYKEFRSTLRAINKTRKMGEVEELKAKEVDEFIDLYTIPVNALLHKNIPFPPRFQTTVTREEMDNLINKIKVEMPLSERDEVGFFDFKKKRLLKDEANALKNKDALEGIGNKEGVFVRGSGIPESVNHLSSALHKNYQNLGEYLGKELDDTGSMTPQQAIAAAVAKVGDPNITYDTLATIAKIESSMDPHATNENSSAKGMFQFLDGTWEEYRNKIVSKYGVPKDASPFNPYYAALAAAEFRKAIMKQIDRDEASNAGFDDDLTGYLGHFLGPAGANKFIKQYNRGGKHTAARLLVEPQQYEQNKGIMSGTAASFVEHFRKKINTAKSTPESTYIESAKKLTEKRRQAAIKQQEALGKQGKVGTDEYEKLQRVIDAQKSIEIRNAENESHRAASTAKAMKDSLSNTPKGSGMIANSYLTGDFNAMMDQTSRDVQRREEKAPFNMLDTSALESYSSQQASNTADIADLMRTLITLTEKNLQVNIEDIKKRQEIEEKQSKDRVQETKDKRQTHRDMVNSYNQRHGGGMYRGPDIDNNLPVR